MKCAAAGLVPAANGAEAVAVTDLDYVFSKDNPLYAKLEAGL